MLPSETLDVLVVDDSDFFVTITTDKLEDGHGIRTLTANSGDEALSVLAEQSVDCVVSDYEMPEMSGLELYRQVRAEYGLPFILVTGEGDEQTASDAISAGVDDYLRKDEIAAQERLELLANRIENVVAQQRARERYERLVNNSPDEITHVSADGTVIAANEAMAMSFGTERSELVGENLADVLPSDVADERITQGRRAVTAGSAVTFQDDIGVRHFHNIAVPVSEGGGEDSFQLISRDITQQKRSEQELATKNEELALINRLVRHDINNDAQLLIGWAEAATRAEDPDEYLDRIRETGRHVVELTGIARDFIDSVAHGEEFDLEPVALDEVLESELEKKRSAFDDAAIEAASLPAVEVRGNELLSSVFANLLSNAVRHNDKPEPRVEVDVETDERWARVEVADNGPGIPDDRKDEVFGRGEMGAESPGTGLGLYLVQRLVDEFGGRVSVADNEPTGSVFTVELERY